MKKRMMSCIMSSVLGLIVLLVTSCAFGATTVYIPHLTNGYDGWTNFLQADSTSLSDQSFTLTLYNQGTQVFEQSYTVPGIGDEFTPLNLTTLSGAENASCGKVTYSGTNLVFRACYQYVNGGVAEFILSGDRDMALGFYFSSFTTSVTSKGLALANFGAAPAVVYFYALGEGGVLGYTPVASPVTVAANSRFLSDYSSLFPGVSLTALKKIIAVSTSADLSGLVMQGNSTISNLLFTPAVAVTDFSAEGLIGTGDKSGTWSGTWRSTIYRDESGNVTLHIPSVNPDNTFTGTLDVTNSDCGDVKGVPCSGTITETILTLDATYSCMGHTGTLSYTNGIIVQNTVTGTFVLTADVAYGNDAGTFTLHKAD